MRVSAVTRVAALFVLCGAPVVHAQVPDATIVGPVEAMPPGDPSRNAIYNASAIPLKPAGYVEEEYFIEGTANRYTMPELETGTISDSGHPYRSRFIVRRPPADDFNGVVMVEWLNVTGGPDKDIDWWLSGHHFVREGYAFIAVSAQQVGIDTLKEWSPGRYGTLDVSHDGTVERDGLSYDVFSAVAKAVLRTGEMPASGQIDILGGLRAETLIATGHSQSAGRLATYFNSVHPLDPVFDGGMVHGGGGRLRDDQDVRLFKVMAETDMRQRAATPQPDTSYFRQWEVAGTAHADYDFEVEYSRMRLLADGQPPEQAAPRDLGCALPPHSRVPFRDVLNAAYEHLVRWVEDGTEPPTAPRLRVARLLPDLELSRDRHGNVLGGIRLAAHAVPTAKNTGMNSAADGGSRFCYLYGSHQPFDATMLQQLYPTHAGYVEAVREAAGQNLSDGYILPYAVKRTIREAETSQVGRNCEADGTVKFVCGTTNPEDLHQVADTPWVIASGRYSDSEGPLYAVDIRDHSAREIFPASALPPQHDTVTYRACPGPNDIFQPHGLTLREGSRSVHTLYVVGHGAREAIEVFALDAGVAPFLR